LRKLKILFTAVTFLATCTFAEAQGFSSDLKIPIPQRAVSTPTAKLNREGVAELKKGHQERAKQLFYRAYLIDPDDPFTLNNLGYVAELDGDADRALRYYALAARDNTNAIIDRSSEATLKGKPLDDAFQQEQSAEKEVSKTNEQAIVLLQQGQVFEARNLLQFALERHPQDPFLLNNLGYALENTGDLDGALRSYSAAASIHSTQKVVVTPRAKWRGQPISEVADKNAQAVSKLIARGEGTEAEAARLNLRGVAALNDNHPQAAWQFFTQAYQKDAHNAFTLNNLGYVSELEGDWESAESYYEAARSGRDANGRVSYSTRRDAEGRKIDNLAGDNESGVEATLRAVQLARRRAPQPVQLLHRNQTNVGKPEQNATPVPPIGVPSPALPSLPPPNPNQNRNSPNNQRPPDSAPQN
jgi:Flp pilus assembly protein TadD